MEHLLQGLHGVDAPGPAFSINRARDPIVSAYYRVVH